MEAWTMGCCRIPCLRNDLEEEGRGDRHLAERTLLWNDINACHVDLMSLAGVCVCVCVWRSCHSLVHYGFYATFNTYLG